MTTAVLTPANLANTLRDRYGPQFWWPAQSSFEIMLGTVLVQNTAWRNAKLALRQLRRTYSLCPELLVSLSEDRLSLAIRSAGTYRVKARRIQSLIRWLLDGGGIRGRRKMASVALHRSLSAVSGIGPETADCIALYAFDRPAVIADAYARRLGCRLAWLPVDCDYQHAAGLLSPRLPAEPAWLGEWHALLVAHGQEHCRATPRCPGCPLLAHCPHGQQHLRSAPTGNG